MFQDRFHPTFTSTFLSRSIPITRFFSNDVLSLKHKNYSFDIEEKEDTKRKKRENTKKKKIEHTKQGRYIFFHEIAFSLVLGIMHFKVLPVSYTHLTLPTKRIV